MSLNPVVRDVQKERKEEEKNEPETGNWEQEAPAQE